MLQTSTKEINTSTHYETETEKNHKKIQKYVTEMNIIHQQCEDYAVYLQ